MARIDKLFIEAKQLTDKERERDIDKRVFIRNLDWDRTRGTKSP